MTLAIKSKRLIGHFLYLLLWINAVVHFRFSKKILINLVLVLLGITKSGKKYLSRNINLP